MERFPRRAVRYHAGVKRVAPVLLLAAAAALAATVDRIAATVNDVAIPESEVRRAMALSALRPAPDESAESFRTRVLDALIDERLQYDDALRFGPAVPDAADVEAALQKLRDRIAKEGKNPAAEFAAAGLTPEEVRGTVERQLIIERYLQERFRPIAFADEDRAREEYEKRYVPERKAAGLPVPPFETVSEEMRTRSQQRVFTEEVEKWMKELREKARIAIYRIPIPAAGGRTPVVIATAAADRTPTPTPRVSP
jgi:parvulin-like peptidyl-prolyl isomerase